MNGDSQYAPYPIDQQDSGGPQLTYLPTGLWTPIQDERYEFIQQLQNPAVQRLAASAAAQEQGTPEGRADVLEALVNRGVAYKASGDPRSIQQLLTGGFYGPVNRGELKPPSEQLLNETADAIQQIGAGRNVLGGMTDQGMRNEIKGPAQGIRGEYYGFMPGLKGQYGTAAYRSASNAEEAVGSQRPRGPTGAPAEPLNAMQAAAFTGKDPTQITAEDMSRVATDQFIQGYPKIAGTETAESIEAAQGPPQTAEAAALPELEPAQEPSPAEFTETADTGPSPTGFQGTSGGDIIAGDMPIPTHLEYNGTVNGVKIFNGGAIKYHPNTGTLEYEMGGRTFYQTGPFGKPSSIPPNIKRDPVTGDWYDFGNKVIDPVTGQSMPQKIQLQGHAPPYLADKGPDWNLARLAATSPADAHTVDMFSRYLLPMSTARGTLNPEFLRLEPYIVNAIKKNTGEDIDPTTYLLRRQTLMQYGDTGTAGKPGYRVSAANQAILHGEALFGLLDGLAEGKYPDANAIENAIKTRFGAAGVTNYNAFSRLFVTEMLRASKGGAPNEGEVNDILAQLPASGSKQQLEDGLKKVMFKYLDGVMTELNNGYQRTMRVPFPDLIDPEPQAALTHMGFTQFGGRDLTGGQGAAAQAQAAPTATPLPKKDDVVTLRNGQKVRITNIRPDGKMDWEPAQ